MKAVFEILIPLVLIIVLLMCMMNNNTEEYFSVGGDAHPNSNSFKVGAPHCEGFKVGGDAHPNSNSFKVGAPHCEGFKVGANLPGNSKNTCHVTMIWADWCGYSNKADPEFKSLMSEYEGKDVNGCTLTFKQIEEKQLKADPNLMKKYKVKGFPTYFCEMNGKHETFNSIKKDDMLNKIKNCIKNLKIGSGGLQHDAAKVDRLEGPVDGKVLGEVATPKPANNQPKHRRPKHHQPKHHQSKHYKSQNAPGNYAKAYNSIRPSVQGEMLYSSCNDSEYGPVRLDSISRNLAGIGNSLQEVTGYGDCTELEFAPIKYSTGGPQIPSMNSLKPSLGQLPAPHIDSIQGITRPLAFNSPNGNSGNGNSGNGNSGNGNSGNGNSKKARVTMVRAEWCGYCKKAMPEWEKLKEEIHNKVVNGHHITLRDLEQKRDKDEIKKNYSDVNGFPTYVVEVQGPNGEFKKSGTFNSIEKNDMHEKIKKQL